MGRFIPNQIDKSRGKIPMTYDTLNVLLHEIQSLRVVGDNRTTSVDVRPYGTVIHALPQAANSLPRRDDGAVVTEDIAYPSPYQSICLRTGTSSSNYSYVHDECIEMTGQLSGISVGNMNYSLQGSINGQDFSLNQSYTTLSSALSGQSITKDTFMLMSEIECTLSGVANSSAATYGYPLIYKWTVELKHLPLWQYDAADESSLNFNNTTQVKYCTGIYASNIIHPSSTVWRIPVAYVKIVFTDSNHQSCKVSFKKLNTSFNLVTGLYNNDIFTFQEQ